jgi:hypothetical protein
MWHFTSARRNHASYATQAWKLVRQVTWSTCVPQFDAALISLQPLAG